MLANDLQDLGVSPQTANAFTAATAAPVEISENGRGMSGGGGATPQVYRTVDGQTLTQAQIDAMVATSLGKDPAQTGPGGGLLWGGTGGGYSWNGSGTDSSTTPASGSTQPVFDWKAYLTDWGFDSDTVNGLSKIFSTYTDPNQGAAAALAYVRASDWYARTFPGIQQAERLGLVSDEQGYRSYVNNLNDVYQRYYGRAATSQEVFDAITAGHNPNQVDAHFQGQAYVNANKDQIQYQLGAFDAGGRATDTELGALGDQVAGLGNLVGPQLQQRLDAAKQKMARIFQGSLATPALTTLNGGGLAATSFGVGNNKPDVPS